MYVSNSLLGYVAVCSASLSHTHTHTHTHKHCHQYASMPAGGLIQFISYSINSLVVISVVNLTPPPYLALSASMQYSSDGQKDLLPNTSNLLVLLRVFIISVDLEKLFLPALSMAAGVNAVFI